MTPAKEIDGELWVKASDMNLAVAEALKAEREACARIVENYCGAWNDEGYALAAAIRSRT